MSYEELAMAREKRNEKTVGDQRENAEKKIEEALLGTNALTVMVEFADKTTSRATLDAIAREYERKEHIFNIDTYTMFGFMKRHVVTVTVLPPRPPASPAPPPPKWRT